MIIRLKLDPKRKFFVYGIYWAIHLHKLQRFFLVIDPEYGCGGFTPYSDENANVVDPGLDHYLMIKGDYGGDAIVHKAAYLDKAFFADLVNCGVLEKVEMVYNNMRKLGLDPLAP